MITTKWKYVFVSLTAKKFGCTEFVNPKDHSKPVQEVNNLKLANLI